MERTDSDLIKLKKSINFYYNHIKISSEKTNIPVFIVQTKVLWYAIKLVYLKEKEFIIITLETHYKETKKKDLKNRFDKYYDEF